MNKTKSDRLFFYEGEDICLQLANLITEAILVIKKRRVENRRLEIAANAKATLESLKQGTAKKGNVDDLIADLLNDKSDNVERSPQFLLYLQSGDRKYLNT